MMKKETRRTALITGASSGIGRELSRLFAADGYSLVLSARRKDLLDGLAAELARDYGIAAQAIPCDLGRPGAAATLWVEIRRTCPTPIDVVVNNAGIGDSGNFAVADPAMLTAMIQVNVTALTELTRLALPGMIERQTGGILNVSSLAGFQPGGPGMAAYYATKSYVLAFSRGLARELSGSRVRVCALCPGPTHTEFEQRSGAANQRLFKWFTPMDARKVATAGYRAFHRGFPVSVPGLMNKILALGGELPPRRIALEVNRFLLQQGR